MTREAGPRAAPGALPFFRPEPRVSAKVVAEVTSCLTARWRKPPSEGDSALRGGDAADAADVAVRIRGRGAPVAFQVRAERRRPTSEGRSETVRPPHRERRPAAAADPGADASGRRATAGSGASGRRATRHAHGATARRHRPPSCRRPLRPRLRRRLPFPLPTRLRRSRHPRHRRPVRLSHPPTAPALPWSRPRAGRCPTLARRADAAAGRGDSRRPAAGASPAPGSPAAVPRRRRPSSPECRR